MLGVVIDGRYSNDTLLVACICLHGHIQLHLQERKKAIHAIDCWHLEFCMGNSSIYHVRGQLGTHCMADFGLFYPRIQSIYPWQLQKAAVLCSRSCSKYCWALRGFSITSFDGMLISSFVIDIIMAVEYMCSIIHISPRGRTIIGIFRLLGDLFAWFANKESTVVFVIGGVVLLINLFYVAYCFELEKNNSRTHRNQKREKHKKK